MQLDQITEIYTDERDCGAPLSLPEFNTISLRTVSNGIGNYVVISTDRWALDEDNLAELFTAISNMLKKANK